MVKTKKSPRNVVGPQVRRLRYQSRLTQEMLAARCSVLGFELSQATLSKIEAQLRWVADSELIFLADALRVEVADLLPPRPPKRRGP
jgi:transcriptional regulator with XRE-family HTH domain